PEIQIRPGQKGVLANLCKGATRALEIGCWLGESTEIIAREVKKNSGEMVVIDWFGGCEGTEIAEVSREHNIRKMFIDNMTECGLMDVITIIQADSKEAHKFLKDEYFDFIYIDADHRYSMVIQDLRNYYPKLVPSGMFCGHDCDDNEFDEAHVEEDSFNDKHHGVIKAVGAMFGAVQVTASIWSRRKRI
ncbi:unnamed protein product, partial [marine sediment metagenome]